MAIAFVGDAHGCVRHLLGACVALQVERDVVLDAVIQVGDMSIRRGEDPSDFGHHYVRENPAQRDGIELMRPDCEFAASVRRARRALGDQPVLFISGNHEDDDLLAARHADTPQEPIVQVDPHGGFAHVADASILEIGGLRIGFLGGIDLPGSPWHFDPDALATVSAMPAGSIDALVTHDGPHGIATSWRGTTQGSQILSDLLARLRPRLHINGHYHNDVGPWPESATTGYMLNQLVEPARDPWGRNPGNPTQQVTPGSIGVLHPDTGAFEFVHDPWLADIAGEQLDLDSILDRYV